MKAVTTLTIAALAATATIAVARVHPTAETQKAVAAALAAPARADQAGDDARRKPAELLVFSGVGPRDRVVDLIPGSGYWTRIFSGVVGKNGQVRAVWPHAAAKYAEKGLPELQARALANVVAELQPTDLLTVPEPVDLVWTAQNYHDIPNAGGGEAAITAFNAAVYKALKRGGVYMVVDHSATPGSGMSATATLHRIDKETVKAQVVAAGFKFVGETPILANRADDRTKSVFDPQVRGRTDQFVLKFQK